MRTIPTKPVKIDKICLKVRCSLKTTNPETVKNIVDKPLTEGFKTTESIKEFAMVNKYWNIQRERTIITTGIRLPLLILKFISCFLNFSTAEKTKVIKKAMK